MPYPPEIEEYLRLVAERERKFEELQRKRSEPNDQDTRD